MLGSYLQNKNKIEPLGEMPLMGFGTFIGIELDKVENNSARKKLTVDSIVKALATGYRHLDLAENYGNLEAIAEALKVAFKPKEQGGLGLKREELWLTMKANPPFHEDHIDALLKKVGVTYFDLFLIHHSQGSLFESENTLEQGWQSLASIHKDKLQRIGVSNFYEPHLSRLLAICEKQSLVKPYANEIEINIMSKNLTLIDYCRKQDIKMIAYSPLGYAFSGMLLDNEVLLEVAKELHSTAAQAALAWLMAKDIVVIPKTTQEKRLKENFLSTQFTDALQKSPKLLLALESEPDFDASGLSQTAIESKEHGNGLLWNIEAGKNQNITKKSKKK